MIVLYNCTNTNITSVQMTLELTQKHVPEKPQCNKNMESRK